MFKKLLIGAAALLTLGGATMASTAADAWPWRPGWHGGWGWGHPYYRGPGYWGYYGGCRSYWRWNAYAGHYVRVERCY